MEKSMSKISAMLARIIYDGRGVPTPEVEIQTLCGSFRASAPSMSSLQPKDCVELRDNESKNWGGKGV